MADLTHAFTELSEKWLDDAIAIKPSSLPDQVYHYTDAAGLVGMLQSGKIWLTNYKFLNDKSEFVHARKVSNEVLNDFDKEKEDSLSRTLTKEIRNYGEIQNNEEAFVFSLSEHRDDLSQWRGYAKEGMGFTIGFDADQIMKTMTYREDQFTFAKVNYSDKAEMAALKRALLEFRDALEKTKKSAASDDRDSANSAGHLFDWLIQNRGAISKHESFRSEAEWRILSYFERSDKNIKVRVSGLRLVPYAELNIGYTTNKLPLKSVGIGPGFIDPEIKDSVSALLRQYEYEVEIYSAATPYRRL